MGCSVILAVIVRLVQVAFAAASGGMLAYVLMKDISRDKKWIYTEAVAGVSIVTALIGLITAKKWIRFQFLPDTILCVAWFTAFGLLLDFLKKKSHCGAWQWKEITEGHVCGRYMGAEAFALLSGLAWCVSALVGFGVFIGGKNLKIKINIKK